MANRDCRTVEEFLQGSKTKEKKKLHDANSPEINDKGCFL
jgi:hypothetical protein